MAKTSQVAGFATEEVLVPTSLARRAFVGLCIFAFTVLIAVVHVSVFYEKEGGDDAGMAWTSGEDQWTSMFMGESKGNPGKTEIDGELDKICRFFMAESAIPMAGLGVYTAVDLKDGEQTQPFPDICIYATNAPKGTHFSSHSYSRETFNGRFEGEHPRAACEGVVTLWNNMPDGEATSRLVPMGFKSKAGLHRATHPGAGAITQYYGATSKAVRDVAAGSEITFNYGDRDDHVRKRTSRSIEWLRKHGWCMDHLEIKQSTDPQMGRGAFARRDLPKGAIVAAAPVESYRNRSSFRIDPVESVFVNYCFEVPGSEMLLYPYGQGVNLINHASNRGTDNKPNVALRWSRSPLSHSAWLDLPQKDFWKMVYPGALIVEVMALRDIKQGEELFYDYGPIWERAWKQHVAKWEPPAGADKYIYPAEISLKQPFLTLIEQTKTPYPDHLVTICLRDDRGRTTPPGTRMQWKEPTSTWAFHYMVYCKILKRYKKTGAKQDYYLIAVAFDESHYDSITRETPESDMLIDYDVPHDAIGFAERPYKADMSLPNAFRHPIALPDDMIPRSWRQSG